MSTTIDEDDDREVYVKATLTFSDDSQITLRTVYLGLSPSIYIEPVVTEDEISFEVTSCDLDQDGLAEILELIARHVRDATPAPAADTTPDPEVRGE